MKKFLIFCMMPLLICITACKRDVESVTVIPDNITLSVGESHLIRAVVKPKKAPQGTTWISSNSNIATISASGVVTAVSEGECEISVYADVQKAVCIVKVTAEENGNQLGGNDTSSAEVKSIDIEPDSINIVEGKSMQLTVTILPAEAPQNVTWETSNSAVAKVSTAGMVTAVKEGTCDITATAGNQKAICKVWVIHTATKDSMLTFTVNGVCFNMIFVEGGTFQMGGTSEQGDDANDDEKPVHSVMLSNYHIGETEVTQALWKAVMASEPSENGGWTDEYGKGDDYPAYRFNRTECQNFITKLNGKLSGQLNGMKFVLPTEAQWEYAARGGKRSKGYKYAGGNTIADVAWYDGNSSLKNHPVKTKQPNELGLYDMSGNVWEWCSDWYGDYYSSGVQTNPGGPELGDDRVRRGGSWADPAICCRVSLRSNAYSPSYRFINLGFRLVLVP